MSLRVISTSREITPTSEIITKIMGKSVVDMTDSKGVPVRLRHPSQIHFGETNVRLDKNQTEIKRRGQPPTDLSAVEPFNEPISSPKISAASKPDRRGTVEGGRLGRVREIKCSCGCLQRTNQNTVTCCQPKVIHK